MKEIEEKKSRPPTELDKIESIIRTDRLTPAFNNNNGFDLESHQICKILHLN
jgi:hypothetical protein